MAESYNIDIPKDLIDDVKFSIEYRHRVSSSKGAYPVPLSHDKLFPDDLENNLVFFTKKIVGEYSCLPFSFMSNRKVRVKQHESDEAMRDKKKKTIADLLAHYWNNENIFNNLEATCIYWANKLEEKSERLKSYNRIILVLLEVLKIDFKEKEERGFKCKKIRELFIELLIVKLCVCISEYKFQIWRIVSKILEMQVICGLNLDQTQVR